MRPGHWLLVAAACAWAVPASADTPNADCAVRVVHARSTGEGVDARLTRLRPFLEKAPFTAWKRFDLLEQKDVSLSIGAPVTVELPNGKHASLTYVQHLKTSEGPHRLEMRMVIEGGKHKLLDTAFVLDAGGVVLQAGQKHQDGMLVLGFTCDVHHDHP